MGRELETQLFPGFLKYSLKQSTLLFLQTIMLGTGDVLYKGENEGLVFPVCHCYVTCYYL